MPQPQGVVCRSRWARELHGLGGVAIMELLVCHCGCYKLGACCVCAVRVVLVELLRSPLLTGGLEPHRLGTGPCRVSWECLFWEPGLFVHFLLLCVDWLNLERISFRSQPLPVTVVHGSSEQPRTADLS